MKPNLRNALAVIGGLIIGGLVNAMIIKFGSPLVPVPEGVNPEDIASISAHASEYGAKHFIIPFLAHALGTLVAAIIVCKAAASHKSLLSGLVSGFFLAGGAMMAFLLPAFWKYSLIDVVLAYVPMALIASSLVDKEDRSIRQLIIGAFIGLVLGGLIGFVGMQFAK